jgi:hypothetical protein
MANDSTVVVEVPMTLRVSVAFPDQAPNDPQAAATALAGWIADRLIHISHAQIDACNELNRLFPHGVGVVTDVDARVRPAASA